MSRVNRFRDAAWDPQSEISDWGAPHGSCRGLPSRRRFMRQSIGVAAAASVMLGAVLSRDASKKAETPPIELPETPEQALAQLYEGNLRFAAGEALAVHRDIDRVKAVAPKQTPFAAFLGCADSRVPIEIVFDQGFGDLFVTRIAGNVATSENIGSLEFGTLLLGAKVLYVLGHTACGAVTATLKGEEAPGQISGLFQHIRPAARVAAGDVEEAIRENVRNQAQLLAESSPVIARLVRQKKLLVAGGVYDLASGRVAPVEVGV
jgi:carbonic anhydrase